MQHFDDYQTFTDTTLAMPLDEANNIPYSALGMIGEVGEYSEKIHDLVAYNLKKKKTLPPTSDADVVSETTNELLEILSEVVTICARAEKLKKEVRGGQKKLPQTFPHSMEERDEISKELGDLLWYISRAASSLRLTLSQVVSSNVKKLLGRIQRGVLHGWGDNR